VQHGSNAVGSTNRQAHVTAQTEGVRPDFEVSLDRWSARTPPRPWPTRPVRFGNGRPFLTQPGLDLLYVVHVSRKGSTFRIISARVATPSERRTYEDE
jgi:hypothetical protein